jgi:alpha-beta hydrolase superfamily lysophospholipase
VSDDFHLFCRQWSAATPRGAVVLVHGVCEHCGRYGHLVPALNEAGLDVHGFDLAGHGLSSGQRGHIRSWSDYRNDLAAFLRFVGEKERAAGNSGPVFLFGHSMGALIVLDFLLHHRDAAKAAVVAGSPIQPASVANPFLIRIARTLSHACPSFPLPIGIKPSSLSRDEQEVRAAKQDRLCHYRVSARWATEILGAIDCIKQQASAIDTPMLICHGGADRLNSPHGSRWLFEHIASRDKRLIIYDDALHELHNDLCRPQFAADVAAWFGERLERATAS